MSTIFRGFARVKVGRLLQARNANDDFLAVVTSQTTRVWFNTYNFPKTEVGSG